MFTLKTRQANSQALLSAILSLTFMASVAVDPALAKAHKRNAEVALTTTSIDANSGAERAETKIEKREAKRRAAQERSLDDFNADSGIYLNAD